MSLALLMLVVGLLGGPAGGPPGGADAESGTVDGGLLPNGGGFMPPSDGRSS